MLDPKLNTLLAVTETSNFTRAAKLLSLTQPAVSHHINLLEEELGATLFVRCRGRAQLTREGEIVARYARRMKGMYERMLDELSNAEGRLDRIKVGITHTAESNRITEALAMYGNENGNVIITIITDTIKNLYESVENYDLDLAIVESKPMGTGLNSLMLDTDSIVCVLSNNNPLARRSMVTLNDLKKEKLILRLPSSGTRKLFESHLVSVNDSIDNFDVALEVDNIATIKDLIRKDLGVSVLAKSACMDEIRKGKITSLPIENLSMIRETSIIYRPDFMHMEMLHGFMRLYQELEDDGGTRRAAAVNG